MYIIVSSLTFQVQNFGEKLVQLQGRSKHGAGGQLPLPQIWVLPPPPDGFRPDHGRKPAKAMGRFPLKVFSLKLRESVKIYLNFLKCFIFSKVFIYSSRINFSYICQNFLQNYTNILIQILLTFTLSNFTIVFKTYKFSKYFLKVSITCLKFFQKLFKLVLVVYS